ncbi:uncharacterized protein LOC106649089 [Trichogramma pretiosum]|uniref:uncharacterized protein LOC106649089 n=1 Tax=Trichogramma pretiosum TaxID=7493 RepID=UPI0006C96FD2|nr:uncharacterized protein LOC106649089 [Trichogramma pretiosum]
MISMRKLRSLVVCVFVVVCYCGGGVIAEGSGSDDDNQRQYSWRDNSTEMLLNRCRRDCAIYRNVMSCGKFKALQWIDNAVKEKEYVYGPLKIIKLPASAASGERFLPPLPRSKKPSLMSDTMYFLRESAEELLTRRALVYTVEQPQGARSLGSSGIMVLDEEELGQMQRARTFDVTFTADGKNRLFHKKKKSIILPILILLNLLKLKLILLPIFFGVHFIKKLLVLGSLLLPSVLSHLKVCKIAQQPYHHHFWGHNSAEYPPVDYPAYGPEDAWDHRNDVASPQGGYGAGHYPHNFYNPFYYYFQNYNKQRR